MAPRATVRTHEHDYLEHCYVITGDLQIAGRVLQAGDFHLAERGSIHEQLSSREGCLILIVETRDAAMGA